MVNKKATNSFLHNEYKQIDKIYELYNTYILSI